MTLDRLVPGQPWHGPSSSRQDRVNRAVRQVEQWQQSRTGAPGPQAWDGCLAPIKNNSGSDVDRFGVLGIDGVVIDQATNATVFKNLAPLNGTTPDGDDHLGRFAVLPEPIASGKPGVAVISGICVAYVDLVDTDHYWADVKDADTSCLESRTGGTAQILYMDRSTKGMRLAYVRVGHTPYFFQKFELKTSFPNGGVFGGSSYATAYPRAYDNVAKVDVTDLTTTFQVWDYIGDREGTGRDDVASGEHGAYGLAMRFVAQQFAYLGAWMIIDLECP